MDARTWDTRYAGSRQWSEGPNQFVAERLHRLTPGRALDLACGEGRNAIWLASRGWTVTAIDFSGEGIARGRQEAARARLDVDWVVGDVLTHPLPEVDLVVVAYLQLVAEERRAALRRAWSALAPGGTLFLVAHDSSNLAEGTGGPQDPAVLYTATDVLSDLEAGPGTVVTAERVARRIRREDEHGGEQDLVAWDAVVHLVKPPADA
jgi:SAM-dependent methyltransferase